MAKPFQEGDIKKFIELFVVPLLKYKPKNADFHDFLEVLLGINNRVIDRHQVLNSFKMPGRVWRDHKRIAAVGPRDIAEGEVVYIRHDKKARMYDIEARVEPNKKWHIYTLKPDEFKLIEENVKVIPQKPSKRKYLSWQRG